MLLFSTYIVLNIILIIDIFIKIILISCNLVIPIIKCNHLINREFDAEKPNEKWVTDVTKFKVHNEKLYLSPIVDLFNGEVISFYLSRHPVFAQVVDMLEKALKKYQIILI